MDNPFVQHAELQLLRGATAEALAAARMGLTLFADEAALWEIAATCASELADDAYAAICWRRLIELDPLANDARNSLALTLERLKQPLAAEQVYREALAGQSEDATLHCNLGLLLEQLGRLDDAVLHLRRARVLAPDSAVIHSNLAGLLVRLGQVDEAEAAYREALEVQPEFATAHSNLGVLLADLGRMAAAEACFREALRLQPDQLPARMNLGQLLLALGRFAEGWPLYEARQYVHAEVGRVQVMAPPACPQWQGEPLAGRRIVVLPEQGLGDEIQFCRYLAWLKAQGVAHLTLICRPSQKALLQTLAGPDAVFDLSEAAAHLNGHDYWTFLLSLPLHAGTRLETIPAPIPYLAADPARQAALGQRLAGPGLRVGLVWRGNPRHVNDAERSLPGLAVLAPLWAVADVRFFSLQKSAEALPLSLPGLPLVDLAPAIGDFADTAALLSQLDLLISIDSAVAHLAGALGVPCWLLLPAGKTDWRWLRERDDSPWYPTTRLFRQARRGDWGGPVQAMVAALQVLRERIAAR